MYATMLWGWLTNIHTCCTEICRKLNGICYKNYLIQFSFQKQSFKCMLILTNFLSLYFPPCNPNTHHVQQEATQVTSNQNMATLEQCSQQRCFLSLVHCLLCMHSRWSQSKGCCRLFPFSAVWKWITVPSNYMQIGTAACMIISKTSITTDNLF